MFGLSLVVQSGIWVLFGFDVFYCRGQTAGLTVNKQRLDEFSMVFYNNLLSLPLLGALVVAYGEVSGSACSLAPFAWSFF